jgi:4-amino-4-deoxychorismate lyase
MPAEGAFRDGQPASFDLIETLRWEPANGFVRLERHLARLYNSAAEFGFACDPERVGTVLAHAVGGSGPLRVRLVLARNGEVDVAAQPYEPLPADRIWTLRIARQRLDSTDTPLRHKTTRRHAYTHARAEYLVQQADEVLLLNERGEVCEGTITTLFVDLGDGELSTPRLDCGLLAGVLRAELLEKGQAREAIVTLLELRAARSIYIGNSLRGLIPARLA